MEFIVNYPKEKDFFKQIALIRATSLWEQINKIKDKETRLKVFHGIIEQLKNDKL